MDKQYLIHYGVRGQRWGFRKDPSESSGKKRRKLTKRQTKKKVEKQLNNKHIGKGKKVVGGILAGIGATAAADFVLSRAQGQISVVEWMGMAAALKFGPK